MDIYINTIKKVAIEAKRTVHLKDIAEVYAPQAILSKAKNVKVFRIDDDTNEEKKFLVGIIDVVKAISNEFPDCKVTSLGETDTIIDYSPSKKKENKLFAYAKIALVFSVLFAGSSTAIMSFHSDAQIPDIFKNYYYIFFNETTRNPYLLDIPYSIGLAFGIIVFFNHFSKKKMTNDPTPIEVEMSLYEQEVTDCEIDTLNSEKKQAGK